MREDPRMLARALCSWLSFRFCLTEIKSEQFLEMWIRGGNTVTKAIAAVDAITESPELHPHSNIVDMWDPHDEVIRRVGVFFDTGKIEVLTGWRPETRVASPAARREGRATEKREAKRKQIVSSTTEIKCAECGMTAPEGTPRNRAIRLFDVHHVVPVSRGGSDDNENLQLLCVQCHAKAHTEEKIGKALQEAAR